MSVNSLDSIIDGDGYGEGNGNVSALITSIIGGQITDIVISPIVNVLRAVGFSNLRVRSSIISEESQKEEDTMTFGAFIEAESPIYKDKLFWKVKANFMDSNENRSDSGSHSYNTGVADYDISMYYKFNNNVSWGVGVQRLRENLETKSRDMNHYTELKFEKRFDLKI